MTATLPLSGRVVVDTIDDTYELDLDFRFAVLFNLAADAAGRVVEPERFTFDTVEGSVGEPLIFDAAGTFPRVTGWVLGITPAPVEVLA